VAIEYSIFDDPLRSLSLLQSVLNAILRTHVQLLTKTSTGVECRAVPLR